MINENKAAKFVIQNLFMLRVVAVLAIVFAIFIENIGKRLSTWDEFRYSGMASQETPKYIYIKEGDRYFGVYGANTEESIDYMIHYYKSFHLRGSMPTYSCPRHQYIAPFTKFEVLETLPEDSLVVLRRYVYSPRLSTHHTLFVPSFCVHDTVPAAYKTE